MDFPNAVRILAILTEQPAGRSKSAQKLAHYILREPQSVVGMPIATLAREVGVSEPTVNRFCTALGCAGFPDFKVKLAADLARSQPRVTGSVRADDDWEAVIDKTYHASEASLRTTRDRLSPQAVAAAVDALHRARSITLCGAGASASVAMDARHKFLRFDKPVSTLSDHLDQRVAASTLNPDDCLVCISYTGRTIELVEVARLARARNATVLGITNPGSPLARECQPLLAVEADENTDIYTPMSSRLAQLMVVDILITGLAIREGDLYARRLKTVKKNLGETRYEK